MKMSLVENHAMIKDYLGKSEVVDGIEIFPISVLDWEEFSEVGGKYLLYGYNFINYRLKPQKKMKLFDLVISLVATEVMESQDPECKAIKDLERLFELATKRKATLKTDKYGHWGVEIEDTGIINQHNYDAIREVIMRQNLMFEPLIVEDEYTQKIIDKAVKVRNKSGGEFDFQSMLVYVCNKKQILPSQMKDYTYYQLRCDNEMFQRIDFNDSIHPYRAQGAKVDSMNTYKALETLSNPNSWDKFFVKADKKADADLQRALGG